tara:strand:- start:203 stop:646 length:444 start_codon:yes stop_codon:yes gene_type:complete
MSEIPGETNLNSGDPGRSPETGQDEIQAWADWFSHAASAGGDLAKLAAMELRLALGDTGRIVALVLVAVPLLLLAWIGFSVLVAWLLFLPTLSVVAAIGAFLVVQLIPLGVIWWSIKRYGKSWSFTATRDHIRAFKEGAERAAKTTD